MKNLLVIFALLFAMSCHTYQTFNPLEKEVINYEAGKCYYSVMVDKTNKNATKQKGFILEITPPVFQESEQHFTKETLKNYQKEGESYRIPIQKSYTEIIIDTETLQERRCIPYDNPVGYVLCIRERAAEYKILTESELADSNYTLKTRTIIKNGSFTKRHVRKKTQLLAPNQTFYAAGIWTGLREVFCFMEPQPTPED